MTVTGKYLVEKWLEALESGRYSQTQKCLKDSNGYCCLGVLCDVVDPSGWSKYDENKGIYEFWLNNFWNLPEQIKEQIDSCFYIDGWVKDDLDELIGMNDQGKSFSEIANRIRELVSRKEEEAATDGFSKKSN